MKKAIVTGGARGIGRAIAMQLQTDGYHVYVFDAHHAANCLNGVVYLDVDVTDQKAVQAAVAQIGPVAVLVNNAGITRDGLFVRLSPDDWRAVMAVNLDGAYHCAQAVLPAMMRQQEGVIVSISSVVASTGNAGQTAYAASKAGLESLTRSLAQEYGRWGIRVNAVAPGFITTPMTELLPESVQQAACARTSLQRAGTPNEVANLVSFLVSKKAAYITGQIVHINGGMW